jgi:hypothetical protein
LQQNDLSRSRFMAILAGLGASATGISTFVTAAESSAATLPAHGRTDHHNAEHEHKKLHQAHVQRQAAATHQVPAASSDVNAAAAAQAGKLWRLHPAGAAR